MCAKTYKSGHFLSQELSAEIGDCLSRGWLDKSQQCVVSIKYWSILLARNIKSAHKKADLCLSRLFDAFQVSQKILTYWKTMIFQSAFRISSIMLNAQFFRMQIDNFLSWISSFYKMVRVDRMIPSCYPCSDIFSQTMHWIYDTYATLSLFTSLISK